MKVAEIKEAISKFERERLIGEITVCLPEPLKDYKTIANWDLPQKEQRFAYTEQPDRNKEPTDDFIAQELDRFEHGFWFFCNGILEWITPCHYFFLNYWKDKSKVMKFIDAQRDTFLWWWQIEQMDNMAGGNLVTCRRHGKTAIAICIGYFRSATNKDHRTGIQSKTNKDGKTVFGKLIRSWRKLPDWLKPVDSGETRPATILEFSEPRTRSTKGEKKVYADVLDSSIDFAASEEDAYDGEELNTVIEDETGKCHRRGTEILMHDGTYKKVEDITIGDLLMGDDSQPRLVKSLARGREKCYQVKPVASGWYEWGCNESHILSLIYRNANRQNRFKDNMVYNMSVVDFLKLNKTDRRHFCLYRKQVEYKENKNILIDPYILGTWLGDGISRNTGLASMDTEVSDYWERYAKSIDHLFVANNNSPKCNTFYITAYKRGEPSKKNNFFKYLKDSNLIQNKHIPNEYLINSRENRLKLLAGLIDTDGSTGKYKNYYEITQKNKVLAYGIQKLASELGFKSNINSKIATMRRKDGSMYSCEVFRVHISGLNLYEVPCLIQRKVILKKDFIHKNTRDSLKTCFKLEDVGDDDYFGFTIDANHLYMLKDCTVTHNTVTTNTDTRWGVLQLCLMDGAEIVGKAIRTTTVEEMEKRGGMNMYKTWKDSMMSTLSEETGRTDSLLTNLFVPADYGFKGVHPKTKEPFLDEYGYSNRQLAKDYILATWKNLSPTKLLAAQRKNPLTLKHAFQISENSGTFDKEIYDYLEIQKAYLDGTAEDGIVAPKNLRRTVTFFRDLDGLAKWRDDEQGHASFIWDFGDRLKTNARKMGELSQWRPLNIEEFVGGCDPFAATIVSGPGSMGVLYIFRKGNGDDYENSGLPILRYVQRTRKVEDFHKNVMIICQYFGCKVNYECDVPDYYETFVRELFKHYVMWTPKIAIDPTKRNHTPRPGTLSKDPYAFQKQFQVLVSYLYARWHKILFIELIDQLIDFDVNDRTKSDEVIAFTMALLGGWETGDTPRKDTRTPQFMKFKNSKKRQLSNGGNIDLSEYHKDISDKVVF